MSNLREVVIAAGYRTGQELLDDLISTFGIEGLSKALDARRWVSVGERLPSLETGYVLMYVDFNEPRTVAAIRLGWYDASDGRWRTQIGRLRSHWRVTHWMPLPEPPGANE